MSSRSSLAAAAAALILSAAVPCSSQVVAAPGGGTFPPAAGLQAALPVIIPPDSALGIFLRRDGLDRRADGWKTYLDQATGLGKKYEPGFAKLKEQLAKAETVEALDRAQGELEALEARLGAELMPELGRFSPEMREQAIQVMEGRGLLLRELERKRESLQGEHAQELDALKDHIVHSGLDVGSLDSMYDRIQRVGTPDAGVVSAAGGWLGAWISARRSASDSQYPAPKYVRVSGGDVPTPIQKASTADEASVAKAAREHGIRQDIALAAFRESRKQGVDYRIVLAVIQAESSFNPKATSGVGARGLMQIMPDTGRGLGVSDTSSLYDPLTNIRAGTKYLKQLFGRFCDEAYAQLGSVNPWTRGDVKKAIAAYNAGPGAVDKYGGVPPYRETRGYVVTVLRNFTKFREIFPS